MNKKMFLRGLGTGLIISSIAMFFAFGTDNFSSDNSSKKTLTVSATESDTSKVSTIEEKKSETVFSEITTGNNTTIGEQTTKEMVTSEKTKQEKTTEASSAQKDTTKEVSTEKRTTEEATTQKKTTEETTTQKTTTEEATTQKKTTEEATTQELKPEAVKYENGGGHIVVTEGMDAETICEELLEIGVISDKWSYYNWLLQSGYSNSIEPGTYVFGGYESYAGIVWILLGN